MPAEFFDWKARQTIEAAHGDPETAGPLAAWAEDVKTNRWDEAAGLNVVFRVRGEAAYVHDSPAVRSAWVSRISTPADASEAVKGVSFLSGEEEPIARLHPMLSGVIGAQSSGAALVSFNNAAFESYGKSQSYNAPLGVQDAFRYTTALNRLLADPKRKVRIGDATVVFWSDRPEAGDAELAFASLLSEDAPATDPAEHAATISRVEHFLHAARSGALDDPLARAGQLAADGPQRLAVRVGIALGAGETGTVEIATTSSVRAKVKRVSGWPGREKLTRSPSPRRIWIRLASASSVPSHVTFTS